METRKADLDKRFLSSLSEKEQEEILKKFRIIEPILKKEMKLKLTCKEQNIPFRTIQNWIKKYKETGLIGLSRSKRSDDGKKRVCSEEIHNIIQGIYLKNSHLSKASIHRKLKDFTKSKNLKCPSYQTICNIISAMPKGFVTLAHYGSKV